METNAVQTLIALGAATLSFSVFYIVAAVFWLKWKLEAHKATKTEQGRYRVIGKRWVGNGHDSDVITRGTTASAYIGSISKSQKKGYHALLEKLSSKQDFHSKLHDR